MVGMNGQRQNIRQRGQVAGEDECEVAGGNWLYACIQKQDLTLQTVTVKQGSVAAYLCSTQVL